MANWQKKPVIVQALQFQTNNEPDGAPHMDYLVGWIKDGGGEAFHDKTAIYVHTLEGNMRADVGDWIICGVKGEFYPCKPDIFEATYDLPEELVPNDPRDGNSRTDGLSFGMAIDGLKSGKTVTRAGWNGKGMYLFLVSEGDIDHPALPFGATQQSYIAMRTVSGGVVPWLASQTDVLASDWQFSEVAS